jgi:SAM-dependent methyltransferase
VRDYLPSTYGDRIAEFYDDWYLDQLDPTAAVELLAELARGGRALELGIGTGRVAIPLRERGVDVVGIDASEEMVARLRAKPGGDRIPVLIGDFTDIAVEGTFRIVYVPFTTFFALPSQADQMRCLQNVCDHLETGGYFVMDAFVPDVSRYRNHQNVSVQNVESDLVLMDVSRHDPVAQVINSSHILITEGGVRLIPVVVRYAWPAELDAMALAVGLELRDRFGDYERSAFTSSSNRHVSIYRKRG